MSQFTPGELEVMRILWEGEKAMKPAEIQKRHQPPIKNAALRSVLRVLLEKGHVTRKQVGKAFYYQPKVPKETAAKKMARRMAEVFYGGSSAALIAHLIESEKLSDADIRKLQEIASAKDAPKKSTKAGGSKK